MTKEEKFERIYREHSVDIYRICLHYTANPELSKDIMHQAFFNFYKKFEDVKEEARFSYIVRTVKNLIYNHNRDNKHEFLAAVIFEEEDDTHPQAESTEEDYFQREKDALISELCDRIMKRLHEENEGYYKIFDMLYFKNKTHDEVAKELGVNRDSLYSRTLRAKKWVQKHYGEEYRELIEKIQS